MSHRSVGPEDGFQELATKRVGVERVGGEDWHGAPLNSVPGHLRTLVGLLNLPKVIGERR
jgi:hypothetical protein